MGGVGDTRGNMVVAQEEIWWVVLMILVSSQVQSSEIWSLTGLSLDNKDFDLIMCKRNSLSICKD